MNQIKTHHSYNDVYDWTKQGVGIYDKGFEDGNKVAIFIILQLQDFTTADDGPSCSRNIMSSL